MGKVKTDYSDSNIKNISYNPLKSIKEEYKGLKGYESFKGYEDV